MRKENPSCGISFQIINIKDSEVSTDSIKIDNEIAEKEKEHASENKSGQPPSGMNESSNSKTFPTRLVLLLTLSLMLLLLILACYMLNDDNFSKLIDLLNKVFELLSATFAFGYK